MEPTLGIAEPTPKPFSYSQDSIIEDNIITRKEAAGDYDDQYGENDIAQGDEDEIFFNQDGFIDDDDGNLVYLLKLYVSNDL